MNMSMDLKTILDRIMEIRKQIDFVYDQMRRVRGVKRRSKFDSELEKLYQELFSLRSQLDVYLNMIVDEVREIHRDFKNINDRDPYVRAYHYAKFNEDEKVLEISAHWLRVKSLDEFNNVIESLRNIARKYQIPIKLIIDRRYDHFTLPFDDRMKLEEIYGAKRGFSMDYIIMINP